MILFNSFLSTNFLLLIWEEWTRKNRYYEKHKWTYFFNRGKKIFEPPRFLSVNEAAEQLLEIIENRRGKGEELGEPTVSVYLTNYYSNAP